MKKIFFYILLLSFSLLAGCSTIPTDDIKIEAEADKNFNFSSIKSYAWVGAVGILKDPEGKWKQPKFDVEKEIEFLMDREFRKLGLTETSTNPDMLVAYALGIDMSALKIKDDPKTKSSIIKNIPKGALIVVVVDAKTGYAIWAGQASAKIKQDPDMKIAKGRLDYAITQIIKKMPR
ncbi:MAG: DUF4136 domain-containing protein [Acidiferrobacterales bacterium]